MISAAIFELDLTLLDPGFLDFELGQDRIRASQKPKRQNNGGRNPGHGQLQRIPQQRIVFHDVPQ